MSASEMDLFEVLRGATVHPHPDQAGQADLLRLLNQLLGEQAVLLPDEHARGVWYGWRAAPGDNETLRAVGFDGRNQWLILLGDHGVPVATFEGERAGWLLQACAWGHLVKSSPYIPTDTYGGGLR